VVRNGLLVRRFAHVIAGLLVVSIAAPGAFADGHGDDVLSRARTAERTQLHALAGTTFQMRTHGTVQEGNASHTLDALRRLSIGSDGSVHNDFVWGRFDGQSLDEAALRKATGAPPKPPKQAETLTVALAPLSASDVDVQPVGPVADGGYLLRCRIRRDAAVTAIDIVVDEATGKKRSAAMHPAGRLVKLADRADMQLTYASDGGPAQLRSQFAASILWIKRAADLTTTRLP
jgi:hypothetical protein